MRAVGYSEVTQKAGLTACEPLGKSSTELVVPPSIVAFLMLARPLSVQPVPGRVLGVGLGAGMYELLSPACRKGCVRVGCAHEELSCTFGAACAGMAATSSTATTATTMLRKRVGRMMYGTSGPPCRVAGARRSI